MKSLRNKKLLLKYEKIILVLLLLTIPSITDNLYKKIRDRIYIQYFNITTNNNTTSNLTNLFQNNGTKKNNSIQIKKYNKYNISNTKFKKYFFKGVKDNKIDYKNMMFFNISFADYKFSFKYNMSKIEYHIDFYKNNNIINPSDFLLYNNIHIVCHTYNKSNKKMKIYIISQIYMKINSLNVLNFLRLMKL